MKDKISTKTSTRIKDYWYCDRCKISSNTGNRMIPCPRGGCEAEIRGEYTITTKTDFKPIALPEPLDYSACKGCKYSNLDVTTFPYFNCNICVKNPTVDKGKDFYETK